MTPNLCLNMPNSINPSFHLISYHVGKKKNTHYCPTNKKLIAPNQVNSYRFELYYFDIFPLCPANEFGLFEANRQDEFAPVKNAPGSIEDSPE